MYLFLHGPTIMGKIISLGEEAKSFSGSEGPKKRINVLPNKFMSTSTAEIVAMLSEEWEENNDSHCGVLKVDMINPPMRQQLQVYCFNIKTKQAETCLLWCGSAAPGKVPFWDRRPGITWFS